MTRVLILGASGQIARQATGMLSGDEAVRLTLLARNTARLATVPAHAAVIEADVRDAVRLRAAMRGQDIVYANLTGEDLDAQAESVIAAMKADGVRRLIFILSLGIHDEVPGAFGAWNTATIGEDLKPFRRAGVAIEAAGLDHTIIRPAWLTDADEIDYEVTRRDEPFRGTVVSRRSVADLVVRIIRAPDLHLGDDIGINKPDTDGDKPLFM